VLRKAKTKTYKSFVINNHLSVRETAILRSFVRFHGVLINVSKIYSPNLLCNYLYDLAQKYNNFYNAERILDNPFRLSLSEATGIILKNGLNILGIVAPEKM
jgi:arginyl-tRNA synthetase